MSLTLKEALMRLRNRLMTVQDLYEQCLRRSKQTACLNIYTSKPPDHSVAQQLKLSDKNFDEGKARPLEGIPIAFKDNFCTKGTPTTCTSSMLLNYIPPYDATMVSKCNENGAVLAGKTNMDEFAMGSGSVDSQYGPVKNPWNLLFDNKKNHQSSQDDSVSLDTVDNDNWVVAGGSSGGSAAAVAAGTCLAAFGSDTGGSVRVPASFCGVVGMKPSYGLLSRHGLIPLCNSLDVPGILTQTVEDCAIVLNIVAGHDVQDSTTVTESHSPFLIDPDLDLSNIHIGIPKEYYVPLLQDDMVSLWRRMADTLENAGARVSQVSLPHFEHTQTCYAVLCASEVASNFARYDGIQFGLRTGKEDSTEELYAQTRHVGLSDAVRGRIMAGNFFLLKRNYEDFFVKALKVRRLICEDFRKIFSSGVDLLLTPTVLSDAPTFKWFSEDTNMARCEMTDACVSATNLTGLPAVSLPLGTSNRGLPLGLQLTGSMFSESKLLSVSHWLEREANVPRLSLDFLDQRNEVIQQDL